MAIGQGVLGEDVGAGKKRGNLGLVGANWSPLGPRSPQWGRSPHPWVQGHLQGHLELLQPLLLQLTGLEEELVALQPGRVNEEEGVGPLRAWMGLSGARTPRFTVTQTPGATGDHILGPPGFRVSTKDVDSWVH